MLSVTKHCIALLGDCHSVMISVVVAWFTISAIGLTFAGCPDGWHLSDTVIDKCYLVVTNKTTWFNASDYCRKAAGKNAHLTSISSAFENNNINGQYY